MLKLKLIWVSFNPDAIKIAQHHEIYLKEYLLLEKPDKNITGVQKLSDMHSIAFLVVKKST